MSPLRIKAKTLPTDRAKNRTPSKKTRDRKIASSQGKRGRG